MEPQVAPGAPGMYCWGVSDGRPPPAAAMYGVLAPFDECGPTAPEDAGAAAAAAAEIPGFVSAFYHPLELEGAAAEARLDGSMVASRNHRDAERRRRERIKCHLDQLRSILACDAKMDKASLLAKAVEHVRELKQRAAEIGEMESFPTEVDEVDVLPAGDVSVAASGEGPVITASLCCDDRSGLLPELAETLRSLRLRILRAEIATLGGRVRNVLVVAGDERDDINGEREAEAEGGGGCRREQAAAFLKDALSALVVGRRQVIPGGAARPKRRRVLEGGAATG